MSKNTVAKSDIHDIESGMHEISIKEYGKLRFFKGPNGKIQYLTHDIAGILRMDSGSLDEKLKNIEDGDGLMECRTTKESVPESASTARMLCRVILDGGSKEIGRAASILIWAITDVEVCAELSLIQF